MVDIYLYYQELPGKVNEAVVECPDGSYSGYVDPRQTRAEIRQSIIHILQHIYDLDFEKHDVQEIEAQAHERSDAQGKKFSISNHFIMHPNNSICFDAFEKP